MVTAVARAEARIKQLSCLGLGGEAVMPALFHELQAVVPCHGSCFDFSDENGQRTNIYQENSPVGIVELHAKEFHNRREREVSLDFTEQMRSGAGVLGPEHVLKVDRPTLQNSDLYNLILREIGSHDFVSLIVHDHRRPLGRLMRWRPETAVPFSAEERRRLARLGPFIAHAMLERPKMDWQLVESGRSSLIIADAQGSVLHSTVEGRRLLNLASYPWISRNAPPRFALTLPPAIIRICRNLAGIFRKDATAGPPAYRHRNALGGFMFRAYWLEADKPAGLIGITVSHEEPLPVAVMRRMRDLALSRRQTQVCLLLAMDWSHGRIAQELGISKHTVIAHSRWIYDKLDVHNRTELVARLLSEETHGTILN